MSGCVLNILHISINLIFFFQNNDSDKSDEYSEDEYELPEDRIANKDGVVVFNTPVYDGDDPENAFGPRLWNLFLFLNKFFADQTWWIISDDHF